MTGKNIGNGDKKPNAQNFTGLLRSSQWRLCAVVIARNEAIQKKQKIKTLNTFQLNHSNYY